MPLFRRNVRRKCGLLTGVVSERRGKWEIFWIAESTRYEPRQFSAASLTEVADQATTAALVKYMTGSYVPDAELQFAIYPWDYGRDAPMYDISGGPGEFRARDIQGSDREIAAESLEGLVVALSAEPSGSVAMLRWVRPFAALSPVETWRND
jgi:hypothetical protein